MKLLVIGYGSIGKRHTRLLSEGAEVAVVSQQAVEGFARFASIADAVKDFAPTHVIVSSITSRHANDLDLLAKAGFTGQALVEKPLYASSFEEKESYPFSVHVAYQLRFHPVIVALRDQLRIHRPLTAHIYVGQHLAQWRPDRRTPDTYSAHRAQGGGVMRDLSHELDLVSYLFGEIETYHGLAERTGNVTVDSEDAAAFVLKCARCPIVSLQMNYLDYVARREWIVNTQDLTLKADLVNKTLAINNDVQTIDCDSDDAYRAMHKAWVRSDSNLCSLEEGLALVKLMESVDA